MTAPDTTPAIVIDGLVKDYHGLRPLRVRRLVVQAGDRVALSGFDATSAEVFVNLVNGAILPDQGEVTVFGRRTADITSEDEWLASLDRFGIVSPRAVLLEASSVRQNLALPFTIEIDVLDEAVGATVERLAHEVGLPEDGLDGLAERASAEVRMRIHLARALATNPEVLLLEHPTVAMGRDHVAAFADAVRRAAESRRLTLLAVTEDEAFADLVATAHFRVQGGTGALVNARGWRRWL